MDDTRIQEYEKQLFNLVPSDGASIGNKRLRNTLIEESNDELTDDDYWAIREKLLAAGSLQRGQGKGGSVRRTMIEAEAIIPPATAVEAAVLLDQPSHSELELYEPFAASIAAGYVRDERIEDYVLEITAQQGRRITGGKWTRPDLAVIAIRTFDFVPGKHLELMTFEIKPSIATALEGVFESLAHSIFAHRCYLAVHIPDAQNDQPNQDLERVSAECARHGIGLYTFTDPGDFETFEPVQDARRGVPDPSKLNSFIATQIKDGNKDKIRKLLR